MSAQKNNQGEGDKAADRRYRDSARKHAQQEDVKKQAEEAAEALDGPSAKDLEKAEEKGRSKAKAFDPQVKRKR